MAEAKQFKNRRIGSKMCVKCGKVLTLDQFYLHKDWDVQSNRDAWCKDCVAKTCITKEETRKYAWYNNRRWSDSYWEMAMKKGMYALANDPDYLNTKDESKRRALEEKMAGRYYPSVMNLSGVYQLSANITEDGAFREFDPNSAAGTTARDDKGSFLDDGELIYSREWNGMYFTTSV